MEETYKSKRFVDSIRWVIVDKAGKVINNNPSEDELKYLKKEPRKAQDTRKYKYHTEEELLNYLRQFYKKYGMPPTSKDFDNIEFPRHKIYQKRFGSWMNALNLAGLCVDLMGSQGNSYRGRQAEIGVLDHFKEHPIDLAGENRRSSYDGICPNGMIYDVKSSRLHENTHYKFGTNNKYKEDIEIYYFLAFDKDYKNLDYGWRVPGEMVESSMFYVGLDTGYKFNVCNMEEYDITDKLINVFGNNEFQNRNS